MIEDEVVDFDGMKMGNVAEIGSDFLKLVIQLLEFGMHRLLYHHFDATVDVLPNFIAQGVLVFPAKLIDGG